ncbi:MAG: hypothetical protein H6828_16505 [Planctomycetes bacterium]|nr:hypothetical protein [Planctomycetota bacterium]
MPFARCAYLLFAAAMTSWFAARGLLERTPDLGPLEGWRDRLPLAGPLVVALLAPWWLLARVRPEGDSGSDAQD